MAASEMFIYTISKMFAFENAIYFPFSAIFFGGGFVIVIVVAAVTESFFISSVRTFDRIDVFHRFS